MLSDNEVLQMAQIHLDNAMEYLADLQDTGYEFEIELGDAIRTVGLWSPKLKRTIKAFKIQTKKVYL